jgi:hypothetical protein
MVIRGLLEILTIPKEMTRQKLDTSTNIQEQVKMSLYYTTILLNYQIYILLYN